MRPPPPETEEVTLAIEDLIKKRIIEVFPFKSESFAFCTAFLANQLHLDLLTKSVSHDPSDKSVASFHIIFLIKN